MTKLLQQALDALLPHGSSHGNSWRSVEDAAIKAIEQALAQQEQPSIKDHEIAQLVNTLTKTAIDYRDAQQLRERISQLVVPVLKAKAQQEPCPLAFVEQPAQEPCGYLDEFGNFENMLLAWTRMKEEPGVAWAPVYTHPAPTQPAQGPCGCREGECETKKDKSCRMALEIAERDGIPEWTQEQPSDHEYKRGFADGQKEFSEIAGGDWQTAVVDQLVVHHIYQAAHDKDPRKAIHDLLCISNSIALDPQVSSDAQALIDRGRKEAQQEQPTQEPVGRFLKATYGDYGVLNWHPSYVAKIGDCLYTHPPPTQPALSDDEILNCFYASKSEGMVSYMLAVGRAIEAHCRGGANG
jgi:hypothetical protein